MNRRSFVRVASLAVVALVVSAAAPAARAQGTVSVDDRVTALADAVKKKSDDTAATVVDGLAQAFTNMSEEDKKKAIGALEKTLSAKREDKDDKLFGSVMDAWGKMGELGEKALLKNLKNAAVEKRPVVLATALRALGAHKNAANVKTLTDYLVNSDGTVVAGAADALGNYGDRPEKDRKPIVEELVKNYATFGSAAVAAGTSNKDKGVAKGRLQTVEKSFQSSLQKLTGQDFKDYAAAQKWFNQNKGNKWPEPAAPAKN